MPPYVISSWFFQADEVEALSSIFGHEWQVEDPVERRYSILIHSENSVYEILLQVCFYAVFVTHN